jgi:membrane protein
VSEHEGGVLSEEARHAPGGAQSPLDLSARGWSATLGRTLREIVRNRITITAAGVAFYWFLSVFPLMFAAVALLGLLNASPEFISNINEIITDIAPSDAARILTDAIASAQTRAGANGTLASAVVAIALALWSASSGMAATQVGLDVAYDVEEDRTFLKKRLMGFLLLFGAFILGGVAVGLIVLRGPIEDFLHDHVASGPAMDWAFGALRWAIAIVAVTTLIALFYYIGPNRRPPSWKWISPGGVVATVLWFIASLGFSIYLSRFGGSYAESYGTLAGVVILLLWLFITALAILIGAELNGELERQRAMTATAGNTPTTKNAVPRHTGST